MTTELPVQEAKGGCHCGCASDETPELDARVLPSAIRHAAILGALSSLQPGASMVLIAPHEPVPLLAQVAEQFGDRITHTIGDRKPEAVRVRFTCRAD